MTKKVIQEEVDGEKDDDIQVKSSCRGVSTKHRIPESPKFAALVRRSASIALEQSMGYDGVSTFATAPARIGGETKSVNYGLYKYVGNELSDENTTVLLT